MLLPLNGIDLNVSEAGEGPVVIMVMGTGSPGRVWHTHQRPALVAAGYRVVTFDNRGIAPSTESGEGFTLADMVNDTVALIEHLDVGRVALVGTSLGAQVAQEVSLARGDLVSAQVLLATAARLGPVQAALTAGELELANNPAALSPNYVAALRASLSLSPATLRDDIAARDWLDIIELSGAPPSAGVRAQLALNTGRGDRRAALRSTTVPTLVLGFADDRTLPAYLAKEVAAAIPGARYAEVPQAGHYGYLEQPEVVNTLLLNFLADHHKLGA